MTAYIKFDNADYETLKRTLLELREFTDKWPDDYEKCIGYSARAEKIIDILDYNILGRRTNAKKG